MGSRIAVLSCVHGNMEALEAVQSDIRAQNTGRTVCLGDLVGYGPYPNEVVRFVRKHNIQTVRGCWDEAVALGSEDCGCKFASREDAELGKRAFEWTRRKLSADTIKFLKSMDFGFKLRAKDGNSSVLFVHGSPRSATEYLTESTHDLVLFERAASGECDVLVCGHTHVPFARRLSGTMRVHASLAHSHAGRSRAIGRAETLLKTVELAPKLVVNAGSVGEPRHGGPEATYVILDSKKLEVEIRKVPYAVKKTVDAMNRLGLPEAFGARLAKGLELAVKNKETACAC